MIDVWFTEWCEHFLVCNDLEISYEDFFSPIYTCASVLMHVKMLTKICIYGFVYSFPF